MCCVLHNMFQLLLANMHGLGLWLTGRGLVFLLVIPGILGWGPEGHYTTCKIAEVSMSLYKNVIVAL